MPKHADIFRRKIEGLFSELGPRGWWPRLQYGKSGQLEVKHFPGSRRNWILRGRILEVWEVALGAVMTQNVSWVNAEKALLNLGEAGILKPQEITGCHVLKLGRLIKPARYYSQKAKKLKIAANWLLENETHLESSGHTDLRHMLLSLWGIGRETADVILLYGLDIPVFVVDVYTRRLLSDLTGDASWLTKPYEQVRAFCESAFQDEDDKVAIFQEAHALIVNHAPKGT